MQPQSRVSYVWEEPGVVLPYRTGVSLHSHTSASLESLTFLHKMGTDVPLLGGVFGFYEARCRKRYGLALDFVAGNWRPPLQPRMAYEVEETQILKLGLKALISITDHDDLQAPLLLRTLPEARGIPVSLEWTAPFGRTAFHLGIHNLPSQEGLAWMERFERFTGAPTDGELQGLLRELDRIPQVLIVLNHPLWDLHAIGETAHGEELERFLRENEQCVHALELNGLRHARENRAVVALARRWSQLLISGGDRHGLEPNANLNLTNARSFTEFVEEIRVGRRSHVLFMEQYAKPWEQRILASTLNAVTDFPNFSPGWQRWDERAYHPDRYGVMRPLAELWVGGRAPLPLRVAIEVVRLLRYPTLASSLTPFFTSVNKGSMRLDGLQEAST